MLPINYWAVLVAAIAAPGPRGAAPPIGGPGAEGRPIFWPDRLEDQSFRNAAEALGREMLNVERLHGRAAAQPIAAEYVRRFQNGTYLLQAHSILANP